MPRLAASVWQTVESRFDLDFLSPLGLMGLRGRADNDVEHIFDAFEALGAVASARGMASGVFSQDLDGEDGPFRGGEAAELRRQLADPVRLVSLTPLGTRAMRKRMLAEGREAALVGELADAAPAQMLGVVAEHYTNASAAEEIARWREAHGGSLDPLVQAIDDCPFVTRRVALLQTLASAVPEGPQLLDDLARDPGRRPVVLLARRPNLHPPDATPEEATWMMTGTLLELLELGGPEAVTEQLARFPPGQRKEFVRTVLASGFPVPETVIFGAKWRGTFGAIWPGGLRRDSAGGGAGRGPWLCCRALASTSSMVSASATKRGAAAPGRHADPFHRIARRRIGVTGGGGMSVSPEAVVSGRWRPCSLRCGVRRRPGSGC